MDAALTHRPDETLFHSCSQGSIDLIALLQTDQGLCRALDEVRDGWNATAFTHQDVRWDNILAQKTHAGSRPRLWLVDWETAGLGDPDWDLGCLYAEHLSHWLLAAPFDLTSASADYLRPTSKRLEAMQRSIGRAWKGYADLLELPLSARGQRVLRAVRYAGARLVHRAIEIDQQAVVPSAEAVRHLQAGANILADSTTAATDLFRLGSNT